MILVVKKLGHATPKVTVITNAKIDHYAQR